jgi:hypothetical protein
MATLAVRMTMLRRFAPHWSAALLAASLLFYAAILLQPLSTGDPNSVAPMSQLAVLRAKALEPIASVGTAIHRHNVREDAVVIRVSAGTR